MWSVYDGSDVEWGVGLGEMCVTDYCTVWYTHYLVYIMISNADSSTLVSAHFWGCIVYNMGSWYYIVILRI